MVTWVDLVITLTLILFAFSGLKKSLFWEIFNLFGFILSFLFSLQFYSLFASYVEKNLLLPRSFANALGFMAVWYLTETVIVVLGKVFHWGLPKIPIPGEEFLSIIPAFLRGVIFIAVILLLLLTFPFQPQVNKDIQRSKISHLILSGVYQFEAPLKQALGGLANDTLTLLTIGPQSNEIVDLRFKTNKFVFNEELERNMIEFVNRERIKRGLELLQYSTRLRDIGRDHSADMFRRGYFAHLSPEGGDVLDRAKQEDIFFTIVGENLAYAPSLELAHNGLMNSPGHRANILSSDYKKVGIGIADSEGYGLMITQVFSN